MKTFLAIFMLLIFSSCINQNNNKQKGFAPQAKETVVEYHPQGVTLDNFELSQGIKLSVMVPEDLTAANQQLLQNRLIQIASRGGMSAIGATPTIVIAPLFALLSEGVTATAPAKHLLKYDVTFYIANTITGEIYNSASLNLAGVGDSQELALQNLIESISAGDPIFTKLIDGAEQRIINYYEQNGDRIIAQAQSAAASNQYDVAISLLSSIPIECAAQYDKAQEALEPILAKHTAIYAEKAYAQMQSCMTVATPESFAEAMQYYLMIPYDSETKSRADALYDTTKSKLDKAAQEELELERTRIDKAIDSATQLEMMQLKMNIEANDELVTKYKKDAAYERLPWLRKLVHLGDYDPFDGTNETIKFSDLKIN